MKTPVRKVIRILSLSFIIIPIMIMFFNLQIGFVLFVTGMFISARMFLMARVDEDAELDEDERLKNERRQVNHANIIMVQIVDENGRDLPRHIADQRIREAQLRAGPLDTVMPVRKVLE